MNTALAAILILFSFNAFAENGDLILPDTRFEAKFDRPVCETFDDAALSLPVLNDRKIQFEVLQADRMVINFLITANFEEEGSLCRYSTLLMQGSRKSLVVQESKAFALTGASQCLEGKAEIDQLLSGRLPYDYTGKPIRWISLKLTSEKASAIAKAACGETAKSFKLVFDKVPGHI